MKPFSQRWMLPRVLGERTSGIGGGGSKALPAGQRAPVPPAAGLGGQEGKCSPSSTPGGSLGRERRNRGAGFSQQPSPGLGRQVGAHLGFPGVALSWARLPGRCHRTLQRCARQINRVQSASSWSRTPPHPAHPAAVESNPGNDQKRRRGFMGHSKGPTGFALQIQCYQCEEFQLNNDCSSPEFIVNCTVNVQDMCQKEVMEQSAGIMYRKSCASSAACLIASAGYQSFCSPGKLNSVCISCCNTPLCNGPRPKKRSSSATALRPWLPSTILLLKIALFLAHC
uniref:LY6/PLAUR domain containing 1 n=1 Tax=Bos taurus TaxID=9913 RepID=A0AAA9TDM1_BOVIN